MIGFGALNLDELYRVQSVLVDNETSIKEHKSTPGGSAANTIYGLAKLWVMTGFGGIIGDDAEGKILMHDFQKVGVDTTEIRITAKARTGSVLCLSDQQGRRYQELYSEPL